MKPLLLFVSCAWMLSVHPAAARSLEPRTVGLTDLPVWTVVTSETALPAGPGHWDTSVFTGEETVVARKNRKKWKKKYHRERRRSRRNAAAAFVGGAVLGGVIAGAAASSNERWERDYPDRRPYGGDPRYDYYPYD